MPLAVILYNICRITQGGSVKHFDKFIMSLRNDIVTRLNQHPNAQKVLEDYWFNIYLTRLDPQSLDCLTKRVPVRKQLPLAALCYERALDILEETC